MIVQIARVRHNACALPTQHSLRQTKPVSEDR